jgi:hypothetical protein
VIQIPVPAARLPIETRAAAPSAPLVSAPVVTAPPVPDSPPVANAGAEEAARAVLPPTTTTATVVNDEQEIRILLDAYRQSYVRLDAVSTARLWPGVDTAALSRAFSTIARQQVEFEQCALSVLGDRATARCEGSLEYVRRVGNGTARSRELSWAFELDRSTGRWLISRVTAQ